MAAGNTYRPIATTTVSGSSTNTYTFSSISGSYTDLVLIINTGAVSAGNTFQMTVNGDTATNYSQTELWGNGTTASSGRRSTEASWYITGSRVGNDTTLTSMSRVFLMNYSNATTYKTILNRQDSAGKGTMGMVGLWRSTAAITSITITTPSDNFLSGSTLTLYGILAA